MVDRGSMIHRLALALAGTAVLVAGCAGASPSATVTGHGSPSVEPSTVSSSLTSIPAPSASASVLQGFHYSDILQVGVNRLAVREAPTPASPLMQGFRVVNVPAPEPIGDIRLNSGDFVSVHLGPLPIGDKVWYLVYPAQDARLHYSFVEWRFSGGNAGGSQPGWVAASVGNQQYLTLYRRPGPQEIEEYLPVGLTVSGTGDYDSPPQPRNDTFTFNWAETLGDRPATCAFVVSLVPEDGSQPVVAVQTSTSDVESGPLSGPGAAVNAPWGPSAGGTWDSFTVSIRSDCTWTVGLHALFHD